VDFCLVFWWLVGLPPVVPSLPHDFIVWFLILTIRDKIVHQQRYYFFQQIFNIAPEGGLPIRATRHSSKNQKRKQGRCAVCSPGKSWSKGVALCGKNPKSGARASLRLFFNQKGS